jgi:hypothetical protein
VSPAWSNRLNKSHLDIIYHTLKTGERFGRLCLRVPSRFRVFLGELSGIIYVIRQKTPLRIVEFVPKTPLEELINHCEGEHADVCERLAC